MNTMKRIAVNTVTAALLFGMAGCTLLGAGIGAAAGSGTSVGVVGGAVIGGVVGYQVGK
jgi:hypothetical protein